MSGLTFRLTAGTNVGCVRTNNEDNFIVNEDLSKSDWILPIDTSQEITLGENGCILVVADGMGGLNAGEVASAIAVETVKQQFEKADFKKISSSEKSIEKFMREVVAEADRAIKKRVKEDAATSGMGTTLIFVWVYGREAHLVWCGDSRAYIYNPSSGLIRFSKDHSYVQELVDMGKLDPELAFDHPNSNIITRCLGDFKDKAKPDYNVKNLSEGDVILLCSDGLCGLCRDEEIIDVLEEKDLSIEQRKQMLIQHALDAGGYDNVTVALLEIESLGDSDIPISSTLDISKKKKRTFVRLSVAICIIIFVAIISILIIYQLKPDLFARIAAWIESYKQYTIEQ